MFRPTRYRDQRFIDILERSIHNGEVAVPYCEWMTTMPVTYETWLVLLSPLGNTAWFTHGWLRTANANPFTRQELLTWIPDLSPRRCTRIWTTPLPSASLRCPSSSGSAPLILWQNGLLLLQAWQHSF